MSAENEQAEAQYEKMTQTPVHKLIVSLSIPTIISMMVTSIYNMADTYFVSGLGTSASAATGIVMGLMSILQAFGFMFGHGAGSNISRKLGSRDVDAAREYASTSFFYSIAAGALIFVLGMIFMNPLMYLLGSTDTILPYARDYAFWILIAGPAMTSSCVMNNILRYEGRAFFAMVGLTTGGILNIFGDALLVNGMHMGIAGAGISTALTQYISMLILLLPYLTGKTQSRFSLKYVTRHFGIVKNIIRDGMPSLARQGLNAVSTMMINNTSSIYGDAAVAAISIVMRIVQFLFCIAVGIGQGLQPVSAFNFGAKIYSRVKSALLFALRSGMILMAALGILGFFSAQWLVKMFRDDPQVIEIGTAALRYQCLILWLMPVTMYGNMLFQSIGLGGIATFLASLRSGAVLIPSLLLLNHFLGLLGVELTQTVSETISALIALPFFFWFFHHLPKDGKTYPA